MSVSNRVRRLVGTVATLALCALLAPSAGTQGQGKKPPKPKSPTAGGQTGAVIWEDRYDASRFEQAFSVAARGGRVFAAGFVLNGPFRDFVVRAYNGATGSLLWQDQANNIDEFASGVVVDDERVYVSGTVFRSGRRYDWILRAYQPDTGQLLWQNLFDLNGGDDFSRGTALAVANGLVFLGGYGTNALGDGDPDYIVRAHNAATGAVVWQDRLDADSGAYTLAVDNGRVFVGGWRDTPVQANAIVRAYDAATGALLWQRASPGAPGFSLTWTISLSVQDGRVFAGQPRALSPFDIDPHVLALDAATGTLLWDQAFSPEGNWRWLSKVDVFGGRGFAVGQGGPDCAPAPLPSNCDALVKSYDLETGALRWQRRLDLSGLDDTAEIVTVSNGTVFVQADVEDTFMIPTCCVIGQLMVQAFSAAHGDLLWQALGQRGESGVYNMVVDRSRLFLPGRAVDESTNEWDFVVHAYDVRGHQGNVASLFVVPRYLTLSGSSGTMSFEATFDGTLIPSVSGLIPAQEQSGHVVDDPDDSFSGGGGIGETSHTVVVPAGTQHLRVSLFKDATDGNDDLDLFVFGPGGGLVGFSASFAANETVDIENPTAGTYTVVVHGFETDGPDANYTLFSWALGSGAEGNLLVSGPVPTHGPSGTITLNWSGLLPGRRYFGAISYSNGTAEVGRTLIVIKS